jgi:multiple sugar transport system ATP-binding protein
VAEITLDSLTKRYPDGHLAVDAVSLSIAEGELLVLVGPSGSGKSTLLRMIAGLEEITEGELAIGGVKVNALDPRERRLGMVFQNYALYPHLTVFENIAFPLRLERRHPPEAVREKVEAVARTLELSDELGRKPSQLSGGQKQRVAMGRAMVREAQAFLFDEPLSNLDARLRAQLRTEIARLQRRLKMTTVYVTHDQTEAMTLGDRIAVLRRGVVQQVATPRELHGAPANVFVAGFIGSPQMNFVPGRVEGDRLLLPFAQVPLNDDLQARLAGRAEVLVGLRPQHLEEASQVEEARGAGVTFTAPVERLEWLGEEQHVFLPCALDDAAAQALRAVTAELGERPRAQLVGVLGAESRVKEGEAVTWWFDPARLHLFDPGSGESLAR